MRRPDGRSGTLCFDSFWTGLGPPLPDTEVHFEKGRVISVLPGVRGGLPFGMPSFVDAHCHMLWLGYEKTRLDLSGASCAGQVLDTLNAARPAAGILRGEKWDESSWPGRLLPSQEELDQAAGGRCAFLRRVCGHAALATSAMIARMREIPGCGALEGPLVKEGPVLLFDERFPPAPGEMDEALAAAGGTALRKGVTALRAMEPSGAARGMASRPDPGVDVSLAVWAEDGRPPAEMPVCSGWCRLFGIKLFLDGGIGAGTAAMKGGFADGRVGSLVYSDGQLLQALESIAGAGLDAAVHAIGGEALEQLSRVSSGPAFRRAAGRILITVEHAEELSEAWPAGWDRTLHAFSMQPNFVVRWQFPGGLYDERLGRERASRLNPFLLPLKAGFRLGFGSDGMPFGPLYGIGGAVRGGTALQEIGVAEALHAYPLGAASMAGFPELAVPVGPGRRADLAILSGDPFRVGLDGLEVLAALRDGAMTGGEDL